MKVYFKCEHGCLFKKFISSVQSVTKVHSGYSYSSEADFVNLDVPAINRTFKVKHNSKTRKVQSNMFVGFVTQENQYVSKPVTSTWTFY